MEQERNQGQKETIKAWKAKIDEIEEKLLKSQVQLEEEFEKQKTSFKSFVASTKSKLDNWRDLDEVKKVQTKLTELEGNLNTLKADGIKTFMVQKENIEQEIDKLSVNLKNLGGKAETEFDEWKVRMKSEADYYKNQFEIVRMNLIGDPDDGKESVLEKTKAEAKLKIQELKEKVGNAMDTADDKWDDFAGEVSEGFSKIGSAFKSLFTKDKEQEEKL